MNTYCNFENSCMSISQYLGQFLYYMNYLNIIQLLVKIGENGMPKYNKSPQTSAEE